MQAMIPKVIYQTFKTTSLPPGMGNAQETWERFNPQHDYVFSDDAACLDFLLREFDVDVAAAFRKLGNGAFRADLWRYAQLFVAGGVYADIDMVCLAPLASWLPENMCLVAAPANVDGGLYNAFLAAPARNSMLAATIELAVKRIHEGKQCHPLALTGPVCLGDAVNLTLGRDIGAVFTENDAILKQAGICLLDKRRSQVAEERCLMAGGRAVVQTKYVGYHADLHSVGVTHWSHAD
jgi:mannosyltransferase OCH1-like enzyme